MKNHVAALILLTTAVQPSATQPARDKPIEHVGEIIIIGNTISQDRVIREALGFYPGQVLDRSKLQIAEKKLANLGIFKVDPVMKIRPTVQELKSPGPYKDLLVKVEETSTRRWKLEPGVNVLGQPIVRLLVEERNFDPCRFPATLDDIIEERIFRGGGQEARFEVVRLNLTQLYIELFVNNPLDLALAQVVRGFLRSVSVSCK